jgi:hypothetical protein
MATHVELDPMYNEWKKGILKLWEWYDEVYTNEPHKIWTMPNDGTFHRSHDVLMFETQDIREYLSDTLDKGWWREEEKYILNGIRKFYMLNKRWGMDTERFVTTIVTI